MYTISNLHGRSSGWVLSPILQILLREVTCLSMLQREYVAERGMCVCVCV